MARKFIPPSGSGPEIAGVGSRKGSRQDDADASPSCLIDFAAPALVPPVTATRRLELGSMVIADCVFGPNAGLRLGSAQLTVAVQQSTPLRMEWRPPDADRLQNTLVTPGSANLTGPDQVFWQRWSGNPRVLIVAVDSGFARDVLRRASDRDDGPHALDLRPAINADDPVLRDLAALFGRELAEGGAAGRLFAEGLAASLTVHLVRTYGTLDSRQSHHRGGLSAARLRRVLDYIESNLAADITLGELAEIAGLSQHHFAHAFRQSVGAPPHRYLIERRIHRAKELLADRRLAVSEIGLAVGFSSQSHFTVNFRRLTGTTPGRFRRTL